MENSEAKHKSYRGKGLLIVSLILIITSIVLSVFLIRNVNKTTEDEAEYAHVFPGDSFEIVEQYVDNQPGRTVYIIYMINRQK